MESDPHLVKELLFQTHPDDLSALCATNRIYQSVCQSHNFWQEYYQNSGLLLLHSFPSVSEYAIDFTTSQKTLELVDKMMATLVRDYSDVNGQPLPESMAALTTFVYNYSDFDIDGINYPEFLKFAVRARQNDIRLLETSVNRSIQMLPGGDYHQFGTINTPDVIIGYSRKQRNYPIRFEFQDDDDLRVLHYFLTRNQIRTMIYLMLSHNYSFEWKMTDEF